MEYIANIGDYSGVASQPVFHAAFSAPRERRSLLLGVAALWSHLTGLIGNLVASALFCALSEVGLIARRVGKLDAHRVTRNEIFLYYASPVIFPSWATAIRWIVTSPRRRNLRL